MRMNSKHIIDAQWQPLTASVFRKAIATLGDENIAAFRMHPDQIKAYEKSGFARQVVTFTFTIPDGSARPEGRWVAGIPIEEIENQPLCCIDVIGLDGEVIGKIENIGLAKERA